MKVILLQDVAKIGRRGTVADVPDGYAFNQLIPKKMAEPATSSNLKKQAQTEAVAAAAHAADEARFEAVCSTLTANALVITIEANEQNYLFKAVNAKDIVRAAEAVTSSLSPTWIVIEQPIKSLGEHTIVLQLGDKKVTVPIIVKKKE